MPVVPRVVLLRVILLVRRQVFEQVAPRLRIALTHRPCRDGTRQDLRQPKWGDLRDDVATIADPDNPRAVLSSILLTCFVRRRRALWCLPGVGWVPTEFSDFPCARHDSGSTPRLRCPVDRRIRTERKANHRGRCSRWLDRRCGRGLVSNLRAPSVRRCYRRQWRCQKDQRSNELCRG